MDQLDDIFDDVAVKKARPTGKFQPKAKVRPPKTKSAVASVPSSVAVTAPSQSAKPQETVPSPIPASDEAPFDSILITTDSHVVTEGVVPPSDSLPVNVPYSENFGLGSEVPVEMSTHTNASEFPTGPELLEERDPVTAPGSRSGGGNLMNDTAREREEANVTDSTVFSELTTAPAQRSRKNQPKAKLQTRKSPRLAGNKSISSPQHASQVKTTDNNILHNDVLNDGALTEETSEVLVNDESMHLIEKIQLDSGSHLEGVPEIPAKLVSRRAKKAKHSVHNTASDLSSHQKNACTPGQENETGRVLRPRKRKVSFVEFDEAEDVAPNIELSGDVPYSPIIEDNDHEQIQEECEPKVKKLRKKKSKKPDGDNEKPAKKRKKAKEVSTQAADVKPKRFSHSTKRRPVDASLTNMDPDLLDMRTLCIRDVIRLGEHRDRKAKKEAAAAKPAIKPSTGNSSALDNEEDEPFTYKEGEEDNDEQENHVIEESSILVNYHTYMDRTPTIRWSKEDTELFYEGVSQFGADLSMIQQLFPSRTRHQIKLKYKKEEKQYPLRLRDALTNRTKNLSHYKILIERLKKMAEEEERNAEKDESIDLTGEEVAEEGTAHADDEEAAGDEQIEEEGKEDVAHEVVQGTGDIVEDLYEDEDDIWSQYKSDI